MIKQNNAITNERVRILYERAFASISTAIAGAFIFAYIFREQIASPALLIWLGFMSIVALIRYWLLFDYNKNKQNTPRHDKFEKRFTYATGLVGIGWAFLIVTGLNLPTFEYRIYSLLLLTGIVALSVPIFSSSIRTIYFYITPSIITSIPLLLSRGGENTALGIAMIIFTIMVIRSSKDIFNTLNDTLTLRFQTEEQAQNLKQLQHEKSAAEQRMQGIMDYAPAAIYVKDLDGHFTFVNKKVADLHQMPREELIGKTLHDILPNDIADEIRKNDIDVINAGIPIKYEESAPQDDGSHHYISIKFPLFDEAGKLYAVGGVSTDITERYRTEESLRISQQRLLLHREQSPLGVIEWNTDFEFIGWNPAAEKIFGYTEDEVIGVHITERILPESARTAVDKIWEELLANKGGTYSLNENTTKDGRTILCEWHNTPLIDNKGNVIGVTSLVDDVTKREQSEENLRHSQKMDALGKLTGGIAHDYNNMLSVILGYSELLQKMLSEQPKLKKYIQQINHAAERGVNLTSKLLSFTRHKSSNEENMNLNSLLQYEKDMLEKTLTARIKLVYELEDDLWQVWLDNSELEDVIINLSINAMHAMDGTGQLTIQTRNTTINEVDARLLQIRAGDYVSLSLTDTGCGMDEATKDKMFDPFYSTKGDKGTGLGLSQVYGFVQRSHGAIRVYSELNHGTQIILYFPKYFQKDNDTKSIIENNKSDLSGNEVIMVVDDEESLRSLTAEILSQQGYRVICTNNGKHALELLKKEPIDLLLSDVIMPEMDGYQLAQAVHEKFPAIKIQLVSGFSDDLHVNVINDTFHKNLLYKPYDSTTLLLRIRKLLDRP